MREILMGLGLSETEARLYLAMLKLGPASVQTIATEAVLSRTASYNLISGFQKKGLVSTYDRGKKTFYSVENPDKLDTYFGDKLKSMDVSLDSLRKMIPGLRASSTNKTPRVRFYTGEAGLKAMFRDIQDSGAEEFLEIANIDIVYKNVQEKALLNIRIEEKFHTLKFKAIVQGTPRNPMSGGVFRVLDNKIFGDFEGDILIYSDRIVYISFGAEIEVVILENKILSNTMRSIFLAAWQSATPYGRL